MAQVKPLKLNGGDLQQIDTASDDLTAATLTASTLTSTVAIGTAPFTVTSTTKVANLNADLLDDHDTAYFATADHTHASLHTQNTDTGTTATSFGVDTGGTGFKLKNNAGEVQLRNLADNAYADLRVKDLVVEGTTTTVNSETVTIADNVIVLNSNESGTPAENAGIEVERGTSDNASILWDETAEVWKAGIAGSEAVISLTGHTHGDIYFTETEIGSATDTTGSDLVGDDDSYSNFTPVAATVKGALSGIDTAIGALGSQTTSYTAGVGGIAQYDAVYVSANDTVLKADADGIATARVIGLAQAAIAQGNAGLIQSSGLIASAGSAWTAGAPVYLSTTAGALTQTAPSGSGDVVVEVGIAKNATDLQINIQKPIIIA